MADLKSRIQDDVKATMKAQDKEKLAVLRMLSAAIKQREVDERISLDETQTIAVIEKMIKQRKESLQQYQSAGREDLASKESFEIGLLEVYLPEPLSTSELEAIILQVIQASGASSVKDMGKVMALVKEQTQGRADMAIVSQKVKEKLA